VEEIIYYTESAPNTENVVKVLQPEKFFSEDAKKDLKKGDQFEICPGANQFTQDICSLIELSKGAALIIDYGEDHAFSNSFRVSIFDHSNRFLYRELKSMSL
jgi:SAM-dependent MidA family methyltransferase